MEIEKMTEDLKQQASEIYKEQAHKLRTSDSLSMKKLLYITAGLLVALLVIIQLMGGFKARENPIIASYTPPPLVKKEPPPEWLQDATKPAVPAPAANESTTPAAPPSVKQPPRKPEKPLQTRDDTKQAAKPTRVPATDVPSAPPVPAISPLEQARQELARDIVLEKNPMLVKLRTESDNLGWKAEAEGTEVYKVTFTLIDKASGSPMHYVWRADLSTKTVTPLSYYARKLSSSLTYKSNKAIPA
jgi:type IV secretory pathway VirB10-like protein